LLNLAIRIARIFQLFISTLLKQSYFTMIILQIVSCNYNLAIQMVYHILKNSTFQISYPFYDLGSHPSTISTCLDISSVLWLLILWYFLCLLTECCVGVVWCCVVVCQCELPYDYLIIVHRFVSILQESKQICELSDLSFRWSVHHHFAFRKSIQIYYFLFFLNNFLSNYTFQLVQHFFLFLFKIFFSKLVYFPVSTTFFV